MITIKCCNQQAHAFLLLMGTFFESYEVVNRDVLAWRLYVTFGVRDRFSGSMSNLNRKERNEAWH